MANGTAAPPGAAMGALVGLCAYEAVAEAVNEATQFDVLPSSRRLVEALRPRVVWRFCTPTWLRLLGVLAAGLAFGAARPRRRSAASHQVSGAARR